jgi:hypothetical protein
MGLLLALYHYDSAAGQIYLAGKAMNTLAPSLNLPPPEIWALCFGVSLLFLLLLCGSLVALIMVCCCCCCIKEAAVHVLNPGRVREDGTRVRGGGRAALEERGVYM